MSCDETSVNKNSCARNEASVVSMNTETDAKCRWTGSGLARGNAEIARRRRGRKGGGPHPPDLETSPSRALVDGLEVVVVRHFYLLYRLKCF